MGNLKDKVGTIQKVFFGLSSEFGLVNHNYTRFIILTAGRTGSSMLIDSLNENPVVHSYYELFTQNIDKLGHLRRLLQKEKPVLYLDSFGYHIHPLSIRSVGFSIHYYHCHEGKQKHLWDYLARQHDIRVVHLRRNPFHTYVSWQMARQSGIWHLRNGNEIPSTEDKSIELNISDCLRFFEETDDYQNRYQTLFAGHELLEVWYEDLTKDFHAVTRQIQGFIGAPVVELTQKSTKVIKRPLSAVITNYTQVQQAFVGTRWENYFEA